MGLDPGTERTGYGIVEVSGSTLKCLDYGCVTTERTEPLSRRLLSIFEKTQDLARTWRPGVMAIEQIFFSRNAKTAFQVGQARGVLLLVCAFLDMELDELSPVEIKSAVVGYGKASKEQVKSMTRMILGLDRVPEPDDAADALACAIASSVKRAFSDRVGFRSEV